ncbi:MAG: hypothetical protein P8076_15760 [Gammaproteobacteria bacterium]
MSAPTARAYQLVLHAGDPHWAPDAVGLVAEALADLGLLGDAFVHADAVHYRPGPAFLDAVMFLGCSPAIALEPDGAAGAAGGADPAAFCNTRLGPVSSAVQFRRGCGDIPPRCPRCRARVPDWQPLIDAWRRDPDGYRWICPDCGHARSPVDLHWRHDAGFGRFFVEIWGIHPHEAVPSERLLATLTAIGGGSWRYFYARS